MVYRVSDRIYCFRQHILPRIVWKYTFRVDKKQEAFRLSTQHSLFETDVKE